MSSKETVKDMSASATSTKPDVSTSSLINPHKSATSGQEVNLNLSVSDNGVVSTQTTKSNSSCSEKIEVNLNHSVSDNGVVSTQTTKSYGSCSEKIFSGGTTVSPGTIDAEDTFITIQTKDGQSSQKIPFYQFLEQVVGTKLKSNIRLDISAIMNSGVPPKQHDVDENVASALVSRDTDIKKSQLAYSIDTNTQENNVSQNEKTHQIVRSRGRGRPRKVKTENEQDTDNAKKDTKVEVKQNSEIPRKSKDNHLASSSHQQISVIANTTTQALRRSRRTPTRNSRFKEDFVDSSTLWSKGSSSSSSSWNTQLMTLALAAERHDTKPQKQTCLPRKRIIALSEENANSKTQDSGSNIINLECVDSTVVANEINKNDASEMTLEQDKTGLMEDMSPECAVSTNESHSQVLRRPLDIALNSIVEETSEAMSEKAPVCEGDKEDDVCNVHYYIIMEPKLEVSGQGLLIQRALDGIKFNVADISGNISLQRENLLSSKYPQDRFFACDSCDMIFSSASSWLQHSKDVHGKLVECLGNSEILSKEIHQCSVCEEKFPFQFMLDNHMEKGHHGQDAEYPCTLCRHNFSSAKEREEHWLQAHTGHICSLCGKQFNNAVMLRRHLRSECSRGEFDNSDDNDISDSSYKVKEELCDNSLQVTFIEEEKMSTEVSSTFVEKIPCDLCSSKFSTYSGLWHHKLEAHQQFFPPGFKDKLLERLEKNESMMKSTLPLDASISKQGTKKKYYAIMQPKWSKYRSRLKVSIENKEFRFTVSDRKTVVESEESGILNNSSMLRDSRSDRSLEKHTVFECNQCGENFQFAADYREHRSQEHGECFEIVRFLGAFQCLQCSDTFPCQFMLDEHVKLHEGKKSLPCTLCGLSFHRIQERREHWRKSHPGVGCPNCGKMYASLKYLQKHISLNCQDHYPASKKFTDFQKKQLGNFEMHDEEKKVEKKILRCHLCPKICSSIHCWRRHMSENHEDDGFSKLSNSCIICSKVIYGYKALEKHLLQEHAEESGLPIEEENTIVKEALRKSKMDIVEYRKAGKDQDNIYQDEEGLYHCPECPKTHPDLKALMIHNKTHINMQLECSVCRKTFKNPTLLKQHVMRHRTKAVYSCNTCGKKFVTLQKLNKHNKVHHSKENYVCELCGMSFALNDYLLKHKKCHTDKRPHSCSVCGKNFRTKPELRVHVLIHTQETPYVCDHCGRGFTQKGNWRIHLAQHTGVKPHKCSHCELSFALPSHLKRHLLTHDQKVNYRCIWCDKECTQRKHMHMHVSRVHKEDFFQYEEQMKLELPVPIAPSQLKMYNRRLGKAGQVRKAYRTRAKKCDTSSEDIMKGVTAVEDIDESCHDSENLTMETIIEPMVETVTTDLSLTNQDIPQDSSLQILVSRDHQNYAKHNAAGELIGDDSSNVEIVMGDNHEINIIINNNDTAMNSDMSVQESLEEGTAAALPQFPEHATQLHGSLQQAVNALVNGSKGICGDENMTLGIDSLGQGTDTYAIVYPS